MSYMKTRRWGHPGLFWSFFPCFSWCSIKKYDEKPNYLISCQIKSNHNQMTGCAFWPFVLLGSESLSQHAPWANGRWGAAVCRWRWDSCLQCESGWRCCLERPAPLSDLLPVMCFVNLGAPLSLYGLNSADFSVMELRNLHSIRVCQHPKYRCATVIIIFTSGRLLWLTIVSVYLTEWLHIMTKNLCITSGNNRPPAARCGAHVIGKNV